MKVLAIFFLALGFVMPIMSMDDDNIYDPPPPTTTANSASTVNTTDSNNTATINPPKVTYTAPGLTIKRVFISEGLRNFCIYTAVNQDKRFENPFYCWHRVERRAIALRDHHTVIPDHYELNHAHDFIRYKDVALCDNTLQQFVQFLANPDAELKITFPRMKIYTQNKSGAWILTTKRDTLIYDSCKIDVKIILGSWIHIKTRSLLEATVKARENRAYWEQYANEKG